MEKQRKMCVDCTHLKADSMSMLTYCTLENPPKYVHLINPACDKWSDVTKRVLPIKCRICGKEGSMTGKNTLPDGWGNLLNPNHHYCPDCYIRIAQVIDHEIVNRKPDKTRTIVRSIESFYIECFNM